jgi:hypothetical protein
MATLPGDIRQTATVSPREHAATGWFWKLLYILYSLEVGVILLFLPWFGVWENNYLLFKFPGLRPIVSNPFLKGAVLGLGIVNIIIGLSEIVRFRRDANTYGRS